MSNIQHIPELHRFQIDLEGLEAGHISYRIINYHEWEVDHTEVSPGFRNRGLAKQLVDHIISYAAERNIKLIASCDYAARFIEPAPNAW